MSISASLVRDLREKTGAGMMDCKKALVETNGNFEAAVDWLKVKGLAAAAKKSGRIAAEGLTAVRIYANQAVVIEVNSETDFVSRNESFQNLVKQIAAVAIGCPDLQSLKSQMILDKTVEQTITDNISMIGENINLRRMAGIEITEGVIASYVHNTVIDGLAAAICIAICLPRSINISGDALDSSATNTAIFPKPQGLTRNDIDPNLIQREKDIFTEQSRASGKPDNIIEKMIEGRIRKFLEEVVLLDQIYVLDNKSKISEVIDNASKNLGVPVVIKKFIRFELGEGIEKENKNFADEVASISGVK